MKEIVLSPERRGAWPTDSAKGIRVIFHFRYLALIFPTCVPVNRHEYEKIHRLILDLEGLFQIAKVH